MLQNSLKLSYLHTDVKISHKVLIGDCYEIISNAFRHIKSGVGCDLD